MKRFEGKVALITGAASGIGRATAKLLVEEGARVILGDRDKPPLDELSVSLGEQAFSATVDVSELEQVEEFTDAGVAHFGRLDVVFNNAGIGGHGSIDESTPDLWHTIMKVDLDSVYFGCRAAIKHLKTSGGGAIVNTASVSGRQADYGLFADNAAKGGVINFTRAAALDYAREGIRVNCVCPGPIETGLTKPMEQIEPIMRAMKVNLPMGRMGLAHEVAAAVAFLASDEASYINGVALPVDGGLGAWTGQANFTKAFAILRGEE